ncbi:hypothetical protein DPMN_194524 [Dreissena polymorpha]|uniref:Uncharacterized protein n=1 Tax=Dreissena polymorpha TaxID=45954 RepID=A0A9D3Y5R7_DREPO|nr:hypothetical protein DPMN_194524 [Dreissena polymorpha]
MYVSGKTHRRANSAPRLLLFIAPSVVLASKGNNLLPRFPSTKSKAIPFSTGNSSVAFLFRSSYVVVNGKMTVLSDRLPKVIITSNNHPGYADTLITDGTSIPDNNKSHVQEVSSSGFFKLYHKF